MKFRLPKTTMVHLYTAVVEYILTSSITMWYGAPTARDKSKLQRIVCSAKKVIGCNLPYLQDRKLHNPGRTFGTAGYICFCTLIMYFKYF